MSGSLESVRWNACVHILDLDLYSHPKELSGNGAEPVLTPREKSPLLEKCSKEDGAHDAASSRAASPTHYQRAIPAPFEISNCDNECTWQTDIPWPQLSSIYWHGRCSLLLLPEMQRDKVYHQLLTSSIDIRWNCPGWNLWNLRSLRTFPWGHVCSYAN